MRKFYLQDENGLRLDLNNTKEYFFSDPTGLGMKKTIAFSADGSGFAGVAERTVDPINIVGNICITKNHYSRYRSLVSFLMRAQTLTFIYIPSGSDEYCVDVECEYITKTEIAAGVLTCPVSFRGKTLWYRMTPTIINIVQPFDIENPFVYDAEYSMTYTLDGVTDATITAEGHVPAAIDLYVRGKLVNPVIKLQTIDGELLGRCKIAETVAARSTLRLCTKYNGEAGIWIDGISKTDSIDLTDNVFFRLPIGTRCLLSVTDDSQTDTNVTVYVYEYFLTV